MKIIIRALLATSLGLGLPIAAANAQSVTIGSDVPTNRALTIIFFGPVGQSFTSATDTLTSFGFEFTSLNPGSLNAPITFSLLAGETLTGTALFNSAFTLPSSINSVNVQQFFDIPLPNISVVRGSRYTGMITTTSERNALLLGPGVDVQTGVLAGGDAFAGGRLLSAVPTGFTNCDTASSNCDANFRVTGNLVTAVPEPSTWAMLLVGFAGIGAMLRRRTTRCVRFDLNLGKG